MLLDLQEALMVAATQHAVAWRFGNWTARQRLLSVHEELLKEVRRGLQKLNHQMAQESPEFRRAFVVEFQRWVHSLPAPAREQLDLLKAYTQVLSDQNPK